MKSSGFFRTGNFKNKENLKKYGILCQKSTFSKGEFWKNKENLKKHGIFKNVMQRPGFFGTGIF